MAKYEFTGTIKDMSIGLMGNTATLILTLNEKSEARAMFNELNDKKLRIGVKQYRERRSLDANAYAWVLISKIADVMNVTPLEVYRHNIKEMPYSVICVKDDAVDLTCRVWENNGLGWQTETFPSKFEGFTNVKCFKGSSEYDGEQMGKLIDSLQIEAKGLGIPTKEQYEIDRLIAEWEGRQN